MQPQGDRLEPAVDQVESSGTTQGARRQRRTPLAPAGARMWGRYEHTLDSNGRITIPQRLRDKLGPEFMVTMGPGHHIRIYPLAVWEGIEESLVTCSLSDDLDPEMVFLQRMMANGEILSCDNASRVSLPRHLREWANIRETELAVILGSGARLEVWNRSKFDECSKEFTEERAGALSGRLRSELISSSDQPQLAYTAAVVEVPDEPVR